SERRRAVAGGEKCGDINRHEQRNGSEQVHRGSFHRITHFAAGSGIMWQRSMSWSQWRTDAALFVLRVACGLIFIPHGVAKVFGSGGVAKFASSLPSYGIPTFLGYVAAYSEFVGGILLIAGLLTRLDALLLAGTMFVAAFVVALPDAVRDPDAGGNKIFAAIRGMELPLSVLAAMIALVLLGGGRWSVDALIWRKKEAAATAPPPQ